LGGSADVTVPSHYVSEGIIFIDGAIAPVVVELAGQTIYDYTGSGTLDTGGDAPFIIDSDGNVVYDYSSTGSELGGGPVLSGNVGVEYIPGTGLVPERGGRGVVSVGLLRRKAKILTPNIYIWHAPLLRRFALKLTGSADVEFKASEKFTFLKTLNKIPTSPIPEKPEFLLAINKYIELIPKSYQHSDNSGKLSFTGHASVEFLSSPYGVDIQKDDIEILLMVMDETPTVVLSQDAKINQLRKEDSLLLDLI
jgi:hypothetical protein